MVEPSWVGRRVSIRRVVTGAQPPRYSDVVGELLAVEAGHAVVDGRSGIVEVPLESVHLARVAPPSTAEELALERIAARGLRAAESATVGGWLLRANGGFTGRANSVLPLAAPGVPLDEALATAREWYAVRGLPLRLQIPTEARRLLDADLGERGWIPSPDVHVMARRLPAAAPTSPLDAGPVVDLAAEPDEPWLACYRPGEADATLVRSLLARHDTVTFAAVQHSGRTVAIGRAAVDDRWVGLTAVEVAPEHRRHGLASAVVAALLHWGVDRGAQHAYLQASAENEPGVALYRRLGFWVHHDYRYRSEP